MILGIISDTHIEDRSDKIPNEVYNHFSDVDLIIHCGDIRSGTVLNDLREICKTIAVKGNTDNLDLPREIITKIGGFNIGIIHGNQIEPRGDILKMKYYALEKTLDILISGHTHVPLIKEITIDELNRKILLLNPGSPTVPRGYAKTIMKVEIKNNSVKPVLIPI